MKTVLPCAVMLLVVLIGAPGYPGTLTLYDDFNAGFIDPARWYGLEREPEPPPGHDGEADTEAIRQVEDGRLRLHYLGYGRTDSNMGKLRRELNLIMQDSPAVTAIQATMEVTAVTTDGCPNDPANYTVAWAWLGGRFFAATNSGTLATGDVLALIHLGRRSLAPVPPPNVLRAVARVFHCFDATCTTFAEPLGTPRDLGPVLLGQKVTLQVQWDQGNQQFIFQRNSTTDVVSYQPTLTFNGNPSIPNKVLSATLFVPNCIPPFLPPPFRPVAFIDARFDDVMVIK
jgi:hypothetical protein